MVHVVASHRSAKARNLPLEVCEDPTAMQLVSDPQETAANPLLATPGGFGVGWTTQDFADTAGALANANPSASSAALRMWQEATSSDPERGPARRICLIHPAGAPQPERGRDELALRHDVRMSVGRSWPSEPTAQNGLP